MSSSTLPAPEPDQLAMEPPADTRPGYAYPLHQAHHRVQLAQRELATALEVLDRYPDAGTLAQRLISRRLRDELDYLARSLHTSAEAYATANPDAHAAQEAPTP